jgi:hypothetical protein
LSQADFSQRFSNGSFNPGFTNAYWWIKINLTNSGGAATKYILLNNPHINLITVLDSAAKTRLELGDKMVVIIDEKEGVVKMDGENWSWLLKPEFDFITYPSSIIAVKKENFWGIINLMTGEYMVKPELDEVFLHGGGFPFVNGIGIFKKDNKYGVINDYGGITETIFDEISLDYEGLLSVRKDDLWGWVNENGQFELDEELATWGWEI